MAYVELREDGANLLELVRVRASGARARTGEALESQREYLRETRADHAYSPAVQKLFDLVLSYIDGADYILTGRTMGLPVRRLSRIEETLKPFKAQGLLFYGYVGCSFGGIHREIAGGHFQKPGYPGIQLEGSFQVGPPSGQLLTRIRAFIEMLQR